MRCRLNWLPLCSLLLMLPPALAAPPKLSVPPLEFRERVLPNGLRVVTLEDHASPTVSVQVWYDVGGKNDPEGRSGFAHLFEHLMFKSTRYLKAEQLDRMTEDVGGMNNASTGDDTTELLTTWCRRIISSGCCGPKPSACRTSMSTTPISSRSAPSSRKSIASGCWRARTGASMNRSRRARTPCIRIGAA